MSRFDVYANPGGMGYVLDVQADVLEALNTRIVGPADACQRGTFASKAPQPDLQDRS